MLRFAFCTVAVLAALFAAEPPAGPTVACIRAGDGQVNGQLVAIVDGTATLRRAEGDVSIPVQELREITFARAAARAIASPWTVWTADGGCMLISELRSGERAEALDLVGYGWRCSGLPLGSIRAVAPRSWLARASAEERQEFSRVRTQPPRGEDTVLVVKASRQQTVHCVVEGVDRVGVRIGLAGQTRAIPWSEVGWVVLSPTSLPSDSSSRQHALELAFGSCVYASSLAMSGSTLIARSGPAAYSIETRSLRSIGIASDAYRYLSDVEPQQTRLQPFLDLVWPPRQDRCVTGGPLVLDGRMYKKGIGMHTHSEVAFDLAEEYEEFRAVVGVDDAARGEGHVVFRVLVDGEVRYESGVKSGADSATAVKVDVSNGRVLTLVADFGSRTQGSGAFADWAEARILRRP
jgi:hypothetical protein